ncbi:MAG: hypothetical protein K2G66_01915, partial [Alistipes sp.]|nr:hypothetical protein [Alistipes sp.]
MRLNDRIWFQADNCLMSYDGESTSTLATRNRILASAVISGKLYVGFENGRIGRLEKGKIEYLSGCDALEGKKIRAILPLRDDLLIATSVNGLYVYDGRSAMPMELPVNDFLKENQLFCATSSGSRYVFGTVSDGAVVVDLASGGANYINKAGGMQNNTVLNAGFDRSGNIWLCLDYGIDYAVYNSPILNLIGSANDVGTGYASMLFGNMMYFGTNQGLFSSTYPFPEGPDPLPLRRELQGQIWEITPAGAGFFAAGDSGISYFSGGVFRRVEGIAGAYAVREIPGMAGCALASCYDGFHILRLEGATWRDAGRVAGAEDVKGRFEFDARGNIWLSHWLKGIYRLHLNADLTAFDVNRLYTAREGLPSEHNNKVTVCDGVPVVASEAGFFTLDTVADRMVKEEELNKAIKFNGRGSLHYAGDQYMVFDREGINAARRDSDGKYSAEQTLVRSLRERMVSGSEHVNMLSPRELIVANRSGFWCVDRSRKVSGSDWSPAPFVSSIYANRDSLIWQAGMRRGDEKEPELSHDLNNLRFEFSCPDFRAEHGVEYSSYLENYDKEWSPYTLENVREYTQLSEGTYTLHLRSRNTHTGAEGESSVTFVVCPPWYRSIPAIIFYLLLLIAGCGAAIRFLLRWKGNAEARIARRKEREMNELREQAEREALRKDYEIATLKSEQLEVDIKHKSSELSNVTMNLIRKNEILNDIASKISRIQDSGELNHTVQRQLGHIQSSIKENISHDDDWKTFHHNFDIVYGDFTRRLSEIHTQLTKADIRLCCYLKMGLSSKEIAPLVNISFKSVEMARYRLRKKMAFDSSVSLTDYLAGIGSHDAPSLP